MIFSAAAMSVARPRCDQGKPEEAREGRLVD